MKKLLILKMGDTLKSISSKYGEFDDHIITKCNIEKSQVIIVDCQNKETMPSIDEVKGIIITGSHSMVTDYETWSVNVSNWLKKIVNTDIPVLGICYGHQLLADMLGGQVGYNPKGMEVGACEITLSEDGKCDKLFSILPDKFKGYEAHSQSVLKLPIEAKILAYNEHDAIQAFSYKNHIWGTQFHPEFFKGTVKEYIKYEKDSLVDSGKNYEEIYNEVKEYNYGDMLLNQFIKIIK